MITLAHAVESRARAMGLYWSEASDVIIGKSTISHSSSRLEQGSGGSHAQFAQFVIRLWTSAADESPVSLTEHARWVDGPTAALWLLTYSTPAQVVRWSGVLLEATKWSRLPEPVPWVCDHANCDAAAEWCDDAAAGVCKSHCPRSPLAVLADRLQAQGDPLGELLALWLSGAPCDACKGSPSRSEVTKTWGADTPPAGLGWQLESCATINGRLRATWGRPRPCCEGHKTALAQRAPQLEVLLAHQDVKPDNAEATQ